jgi:hypothetical protein
MKQKVSRQTAGAIRDLPDVLSACLVRPQYFRS